MFLFDSPYFQMNEETGAKTDNKIASAEQMELLERHADYLIRLKCNKGGLLFEGNYV